jgi:hypothetical protein
MKLVGGPGGVGWGGGIQFKALTNVANKEFCTLPQKGLVLIVPVPMLGRCMQERRHDNRHEPNMHHSGSGWVGDIRREALRNKKCK